MTLAAALRCVNFRTSGKTLVWPEARTIQECHGKPQHTCKHIVIIGTQHACTRFTYHDKTDSMPSINDVFLHLVLPLLQLIMITAGL